MRLVFVPRRPYTPFKKHPKYTGFLALYVHYLYLLGKIKNREYPPKMTPHLKAEIMKFERYMAQFKFLHENSICTPEQLAAHKAEAYEAVAEIKREIRAVRKEIAMCGEVAEMVPAIEKQIQTLSKAKSEKTHHNMYRDQR